MMMNEATTTENKSYYRVSCANCREAHRQCDRVLPSCTRCIDSGLNCCYKPPKNRGRVSKSKEVSKSKTKTNNRAVVTVPTTMNTIRIIQQNNTCRAQNMINLELNPRFTICQPMSSTLEEKMNSAYWYAARALFFHHVPSTKHRPQSTMKLCEDLSKQLSRISPAINGRDLFTMIQSLSNSELYENALNMCNKAKEIVLHPDVFSSIATNASLAHACANIATFLVVDNNSRNIPESLLFSSAAKVFVKDVKSIADSEEVISDNTMSLENRDKMKQYQETVQMVSKNYYSARLIQFFHLDIYKFSMSDLLNVFQALQNMAKYSLKLDHDEETKNHEQFMYKIWSTVIANIKEYSGIQRTKLIQNTLDTVVTVYSGSQKHIYMHAMVNGLQSAVAASEIKTVTDRSEQMELKSLQLKYMHLGMNIAADSLVAEYIAARSPNIIRACQMHLEYCDDLLSNIEQHTTVKLAETVSMLKNVVVFIDRFQNAIQPMYDELLQKFNTRITLLQQKIQQESDEENLLSQLLSMDNLQDYLSNSLIEQPYQQLDFEQYINTTN
jgi:hypothetical protein